MCFVNVNENVYIRLLSSYNSCRRWKLIKASIYAMYTYVCSMHIAMHTQSQNVWKNEIEKPELNRGKLERERKLPFEHHQNVTENENEIEILSGIKCISQCTLDFRWIPVYMKKPSNFFSFRYFLFSSFLLSMLTVSSRFSWAKFRFHSMLPMWFCHERAKFLHTCKHTYAELISYWFQRKHTHTHILFILDLISLSMLTFFLDS